MFQRFSKFFEKKVFNHLKRQRHGIKIYCRYCKNEIINLIQVMIT